jgi:hypothetical protein
VDFSEARDLFVNIFRILDRTGKMPMGNGRGFTADTIDGWGGCERGFKRGNQGGEVRGFDWRRNDGGREARGDQLR